MSDQMKIENLVEVVIQCVNESLLLPPGQVTPQSFLREEIGVSSIDLLNIFHRIETKLSVDFMGQNGNEDLRMEIFSGKDYQVIQLAEMLYKIFQ